MARCPYDKVIHLRKEFDLIKDWPGIKEKKPGTFYFKTKGFLHFHIKDERIWADVRSGENWGPEVDIKLKMSKDEKSKFLKEIEKHYKKTAKLS